MQNTDQFLWSMMDASFTMDKNPIQKKVLRNKFEIFTLEEKNQLTEIFLQEKHDIGHLRKKHNSNYAILQSSLNSKAQQISEKIEKEILQRKNQEQRRLDNLEADKILEELN